MSFEKQKNKVNQQGFTLVELLVSLLIASALGLALLGLRVILDRNQLFILKSYLSVDQANSSVTAMVREIRSSSYSEADAHPLESALEQEIVFYSDIDSDEDIEKVRYFLDGAELKRGYINPVGDPATYPLDQERVKILTENVRNNTTPVFLYYNENWPQDTTNNPLIQPVNPADVRLVKVFLRLNTKAGEPQTDYILESHVQLRLLKENL